MAAEEQSVKSERWRSKETCSDVPAMAGLLMERDVMLRNVLPVTLTEHEAAEDPSLCEKTGALWMIRSSTTESVKYRVDLVMEVMAD